MAATKYKTFADGEVLTAADLNASFDRIFDNQDDLGNPRTDTFDLDGQRLVIDAAGNTSLAATTTNKVDFRLAGQDLVDLDGTVASPVNGLSVVASATGSPVQVKAKGSDTNVGVTIKPKGTGAILLDADPTGTGVDIDGAPLVLDADADSSLRETSDDVIALRLQGMDAVIFDGDAASPVNGLTLRTSATTVAPELAAHGTDSNINVRLTPKGTGVAASAGGWAVDGATNLTWRWTGSGTSMLLQENTGTATSPTWTTRNTLATGVGLPPSAFSLLATYNPSSASSVDITSVISATYDRYEIHFWLRPVSDGDTLLVRTDTSNGASFDNGASDYSYSGAHVSGTSTPVAVNSSIGFTALALGVGVGNATNEGVAGQIHVRFLGSASMFPIISWQVEGLDGSTVMWANFGGGSRRSAAAINALRLVFNAGNIASGNVRVYGVANT